MSLLYRGTVRCEFYPRRHVYQIVDNGEVLKGLPSVTSIVGVIDKSGPLMGWAVKNVLAICRGAIEPDAAYPEIYLEQVWSSASKSYRQVRDAAADLGTEVHNALEVSRKSGLVLPPESDQARACFDAAIGWLGQHNVRTLEVEKRVYSRKHKFVGTFDELAEVDGKLSIIDWKSSKGMYAEYFLQTAAYVMAVEEETGQRVERRYLVHLGKDGTFDPIECKRGSLHKDWQAFLGALRVYRRLKELK